jgi:hypothetical protein
MKDEKGINSGKRHDFKFVCINVTLVCIMRNKVGVAIKVIYHIQEGGGGG